MNFHTAAYLRTLPVFPESSHPGGISEVTQLLSQPKNIVNYGDVEPESPLHKALSEANTRILGDQLDMRFELCATQRGKLLSKETLGRVWTLDWEPTRIQWIHPADASSLNWLLTPQYSGLNAVGADKAFTNAVSALSTELGERTRVVVDSRLRRNIGSLTSRGIAPERFLFRLAILYLLAHVSEKKYGHEQWQLTPDPASVREFSSFGGWRRSLAAAAQGTNFVWLDLDVEEPESRELLAAALAVLDPQNVSGIPEDVTILGQLPSLGATTILVRSAQIQGNTEVALSSFGFRQLMNHISTSWGVAQQMGEALQAASVLMFRPAGQDLAPICQRGLLGGARAVSMCMPMFMTQALVLGPLACHFPDTEGPLNGLSAIDWPSPDLLLVGGAIMWGAWEASYVKCASENGLAVVAAARRQLHGSVASGLLHRLSPPRRAIHKGLALAATQHAMSCCPAPYPKVLNTLGLMRISGYRQVADVLLHQHGVQWEELLPYCTQIPASCSFYGVQKPPQPGTRPPIRRWFKPQLLGSGASGPLLYWASLQADAQVGIEEWNPTENSCRTTPMTLRQGYRGRTLDNQFCEDTLSLEAELRFVVRLPSLETAITVRDARAYSEGTQWEIEWVSIWGPQRSEPHITAQDLPPQVVEPIAEPQEQLQARQEAARTRAKHSGLIDKLRDDIGMFEGTPLELLEQALTTTDSSQSAKSSGLLQVPFTGTASLKMHCN